MNIKKNDYNKKTLRQKVESFFSGKGFYMGLILCIAIVGAAAVIITTSRIISTTDFDGKKMIAEESEKTLELQKQQNSSNVTLGNEKSSSAFTNTGQNKNNAETSKEIVDKKTTDLKNESENSKDKANSAASEEKPKEEIKLQKFTSPIKGETIREFASDTLVYSKTFDDWRTHKGVDILGSRGTLVKVSADGVISEIKNDQNLGVTVVVEHVGNVKTVYSNLAENDMVLVNQKVKQGEAIGCIGNTAKSEILDKEHLHFEVLLKNGPVDPKNYLP